MSGVQASLLFIYFFFWLGCGKLRPRCLWVSESQSSGRESPATPLILIPNSAQETNKPQTNGPGCFSNPQQRLQGKSVIHPCVPPHTPLGVNTSYGCHYTPRIGPFLLGTKYVLHCNIRMIKLLLNRCRSTALNRPKKKKKLKRKKHRRLIFPDAGKGIVNKREETYFKESQSLKSAFSQVTFLKQKNKTWIPMPARIPKRTLKICLAMISKP